MEFSWYLALFYYLWDYSYPEGANKIIKQKIRRHASKYSIYGDYLIEKSSGKQVLHDGNVREILLGIHQESHFGPTQLFRQVEPLFVYKKKLYQASKEIAKGCETCQVRARPIFKRRNLASPMKTPSTPFFMVGCDAVGPLDVTTQGNKYILTAVDYLASWPMAMAVPDITEGTTVKFYYQGIISQHGVPNYILTDRGSNFVSHYTKAVLKQFGCRSRSTTTFRPQSNGLCERLNQTLCRTIAKIARDKNERHEWDKYIHQALLVIRTLTNASTKFSPSQLLYGYQMVTPYTWQAPILDFVEGEYEQDVAARVQFVQEELVKIRGMAREASDKAKEKRAIHYNGAWTTYAILLLESLLKSSNAWTSVVRNNDTSTFSQSISNEQEELNIILRTDEACTKFIGSVTEHRLRSLNAKANTVARETLDGVDDQETTDDTTEYQETACTIDTQENINANDAQETTDDNSLSDDDRSCQLYPTSSITSNNDANVNSDNINVNPWIFRGKNITLMFENYKSVVHDLINKHTKLPLEPYINELAALSHILILNKHQHSSIATKVFSIELLEELAASLSSESMNYNLDFNDQHYMTLTKTITNLSMSIKTREQAIVELTVMSADMDYGPRRLVRERQQ
ncbi:hypothetical protein RMATCC62417_09017 [Rhizopus microsporus]|nr:hypothetical protein RMATCC62417_09017 [Rhizopus microsporus]